jgi:hypothetical protein
VVAITQHEFAGTAVPIPLEVTLANGQVRVHLPFAVDPHALSAQLLREGFPLAHQPDTPDTQGWGPYFDANGYYPYWTYPDPEQPGRTVFAFNPHPEDVIDRKGPDAVVLGKRSRTLVERWVPVLASLRRQNAEVRP